MNAYKIAMGLLVTIMGILILPHTQFAWFQIGAGIFCVSMGARGLEQASKRAEQ